MSVILYMYYKLRDAFSNCNVKIFLASSLIVCHLFYLPALPNKKPMYWVTSWGHLSVKFLKVQQLYKSVFFYCSLFLVGKDTKLLGYDKFICKHTEYMQTHWVHVLLTIMPGSTWVTWVSEYKALSYRLSTL